MNGAAPAAVSGASGPLDMERLLNFDEPLDVGLFDQVVAIYQSGDATNPNFQRAHQVLARFQEQQDAWTRVDTILDFSNNSASKFFALNVLSNIIETHWKALSAEQQQGIRTYIVNLIIKLSSDSANIERDNALLVKADTTLIAILKHDWPANWPSFIPDLIGSSKTSESIALNNMQIMRLLSEEIFEFGTGRMTHAKQGELKVSLNKEFQGIFELCNFVMESSSNPLLLSATLETLNRFLAWIPIGYIYETGLIGALIHKFLPVGAFRVTVMRCLIDIAGNHLPEAYHGQISEMLVWFMSFLKALMPEGTNVQDIYINSGEDLFIRQIAMFLSTLFRTHLDHLERTQENMQYIIAGHEFLIMVSKIDEPEIFKISLEYWLFLTSNLYHDGPLTSGRASTMLMLGGAFNSTTPRRTAYAPVLQELREIIVSRMGRPEEVLITQDDNGDIIRDKITQGEVVMLYKSMREVLVFLMHLDSRATQNILMTRLQLYVNMQEWDVGALNSLCWAIGSISGTMDEGDEKTFLVMVIKDLLNLTERKRGKANKAVVASNIMYIVGQYPRFLRAHWRFLKTVVKKLFEFMEEDFPGVQEMACDTFLKVAQRTRRKFVVMQVAEAEPFVDEILRDHMPNLIRVLNKHEAYTFFEAMGYIVQSQHDPKIRQDLVGRLFALHNQQWDNIMNNTRQNVEYIKTPAVMDDLVHILRINVAAATSLQTSYAHQLERIFFDLLESYKVFAAAISEAVAMGGEYAVQTHLIKHMRSVKHWSLNVIETLLERLSGNVTDFVQKFIPPLLVVVLEDFKSSTDLARDAAVLSLLTALVKYIGADMMPDIPAIFDHVLEPAINLIKHNFEDAPEIRKAFFQLLGAINKYCFNAFMVVTPAQFQAVMDSIIWAFHDRDRDNSEHGLVVLFELFKQIEGKPTAPVFYKSFLLPILTDVFEVLTDGMHKSGFAHQARILCHIFHMVNSGRVTAPLWDEAATPNPPSSNQIYVQRFVCDMLSSRFPNLSPTQVETFVVGLLELSASGEADWEAFKRHLRDFLVQMKEFSNETDKDLFLEDVELKRIEQLALSKEAAASVPGLIPQNEDARVIEGDFS